MTEQQAQQENHSHSTAKDKVQENSYTNNSTACSNHHHSDQSQRKQPPPPPPTQQNPHQSQKSSPPSSSTLSSSFSSSSTSPSQALECVTCPTLKSQNDFKEILVSKYHKIAQVQDELIQSQRTLIRDLLLKSSIAMANNNSGMGTTYFHNFNNFATAFNNNNGNFFNNNHHRHYNNINGDMFNNGGGYTTYIFHDTARGVFESGNNNNIYENGGETSLSTSNVNVESASENHNLGDNENNKNDNGDAIINHDNNNNSDNNNNLMNHNIDCVYNRPFIGDTDLYGEINFVRTLDYDVQQGKKQNYFSCHF